MLKNPDAKIWAPGCLAWCWGGILLATSLCAMGLHRSGQPWQLCWIFFAGSVLVFSIFSLARRKTDGWGWILWGSLLAVIFMILKVIAITFRMLMEHSYRRYPF